MYILILSINSETIQLLSKQDHILCPTGYINHSHIPYCTVGTRQHMSFDHQGVGVR